MQMEASKAVRSGLMLCLVCSILTQFQQVWAHDLHGLFEWERLSKEVRGRLEARRNLRASLPRNPTSDADLREFVIRRLATWKPGMSVRVCFFEGESEPAMRQRIADIANEWTKYGNLTFDFGPPGALLTCNPSEKNDIRVSFRGSDYSSYVGTDSLLIESTKQTMNLRDFDVNPPAEPEFTGIILHEFGHALGFEHEHQHPFSACQEEFDWPALYRALPWPKSEVDVNMRRLSNASAYLVSAYDKASVMHYALGAHIFKRGTGSICYTRPNNGLSEQDKIGMTKAYPHPQAEVRRQPEIREIQRRLQLSPVQRQGLTSLYESLRRSEQR